MKLGLVLSLVLASTVAQDGSEREGKLGLSLFSIVTFANKVCETKASSNSRNGTCYTATECTVKGGNAQGNCAAGFGVCCLFEVSDASSTISENNTYVQNPSYPSAYSSTSALTYTIKKCSDDVCTIRLDFEAFNIVGPTTTTEVPSTTATDGCQDSFQVTGGTGLSSPVICGTNAGQHLYMDIGKESTNTVALKFTFGSTVTSTTRTWAIKVGQIPCAANYRPPTGCLQWHTGLTGAIQTFNWGGVAHLPEQDYSICIRREADMCCVQYAATTETDSFTIVYSAAPAPNNFHDTYCPMDYIAIDGLSDTCDTKTRSLQYSTKVCGDLQGHRSTTGGDATACDCTAPFTIGVFTDDAGDGTAGAANTAASLGISITYKQVPCSSQVA